MNKPIAALLLAFLSSCDRSQETPGSGSLPGIALHVAARRSVVAPETLRVVVRIDGLEALDHRQALSSSRSVELEIPHGSLVRILARIHAGGDTTETGDTSFVMPATPQLGILLHLSAVLSGGAAFSRDPRTRAVKGVAFHDTLLLTEPGSDSADFASVCVPAGMVVARNLLTWTPLDTGTVPVKIAVSLRGRTDTLQWAISVTTPVATPATPVAIPAAGMPFEFGSGVDSGIVPATVRLSSHFEMDPTEVTQAMFDSLMSRTYPGYKHPVWSDSLGLADDMPAYGISPYEAALFCNARSKAAKFDTVFLYDRIVWYAGFPTIVNLRVRQNVRGYRLPTEAEWDFAARGGSDSLHFWKTMPGASASMYANYPSVAGSGTRRVGRLSPNGHGLYDMFGNVSEIVLSIFNDGWYAPDPLDPWGPGIWNWGQGWKFVVRGGSSASEAERTWTYVQSYDPHVGFRTILPAGSGGQGFIVPGTVPSASPASADSTFVVYANSTLYVPFTQWDLFGETLKLSVAPAGPTISGNAVEWVPTRADTGLHVFQVTTTASPSSRESKPFPLKVLVRYNTAPVAP